MLRNREGSRPKFIGFFLVIEKKSTPPSEYAEVIDVSLVLHLHTLRCVTIYFCVWNLQQEFSQATHGKLLVDDSYQSFVRLSCGNVATHYLETPKSEVQVNWTAPEPGAGALSFRATIIENRDIWYMDGIFLSKDLEEDADGQDDYLSNVQEQCCACNEAKYEVWLHFAHFIASKRSSFKIIFSCHSKAYGRSIRTPKISRIMNLGLDLVILLVQRINMETSNVST